MSKKFVKLVAILLIVGLLASTAALALAAPPAQDETPGDVVAVAQADGRFATLVTALETAGLVSTLQGEGPFTVFAPTDAAFAALPEGTLDDLLADVPALTDILLYHVVEGQVMAADVVTLESADSLLGQPLNITVDGESVMVNEANVVLTDVEASNGVIHVIDAVLLPPTDDSAAMEEGATITATETVTGTEAMTTTEAMTATEAMTTTEAVTATETAEATTDTAALCTESYVIQADDTLSSIADRFFGSINAYQGIIDATNAVAPTDDRYRPIDSADLIFAGQTLCIPASPDAEVTPATAETGETEATPEADTTTEETLAAGDIPEGQSKLVFENLSAVDLVVDINGPSIGTANVPPGSMAEFIVDPGSYTYNAHQPGGGFGVAPGSFDLTAGEGQGLTCYADSSCLLRELDTTPTTIDTEEELTTTAEIPAAELDIVDTAIADGRFATLVTALQTAGLTETLKGEGPFTVLAPTDAAFAALPEGALDDLLADTAALSNVLLNHVISGTVPAADVVTLDAAETLAGVSLPITVDGETVQIGEATVILTDVQASNGLIHAIDTVLLPPAAEEADTADDAATEEAPADEETAADDTTDEDTTADEDATADDTTDEETAAEEDAPAEETTDETTTE